MNGASTPVDVMENQNSKVSSDSGEINSTPRRMTRADKVSLIEKIAPRLMQGADDYSTPAIREALAEVGVTLTVKQLHTLKTELLTYLENKRLRPITRLDIANWTDSVKSRIAAQLAPNYKSEGVLPTHSTISAELGKLGYRLAYAQVAAVKEEVETLLQNNEAFGIEREEIQRRRMSSVTFAGILADIRPYFGEHRGYISAEDVRKKVKELGHAVGQNDIKLIRNTLVELLDKRPYKVQNKDVLADLLALSKRLAKYFIQHGHHMPSRTDVVKAGKQLGLEIPYFRTRVLLEMVFEAAPSLANKAKGVASGKNKGVLTPLMTQISTERKRVKLQVSPETLEFLAAFGGSIGKPGKYHLSRVVEQTALLLAYGVYSGKIDLGSLLAGVRHMGPNEMQIATKMLTRTDFGNL